MFLITDEKFQWRIGTGVLKKGSSRKDRSSIVKFIHETIEDNDINNVDLYMLPAKMTFKLYCVIPLLRSTLLLLLLL